MSGVPVTPEMIRFLTDLLVASRQGLIAWETTDRSDAMLAEIDDDYTVVIREVEDFDGGDVPDHILTLLKSSEVIFSLDRRDVDADELPEGLLLDNKRNSYSIFRELWDRAVLTARKVSEHIAAASQALEAKIKAKR